MIRKITIAVSVLLLVACGYLAFQYWFGVMGVPEEADNITITIPDGASFSSIVDTLHEAGLITDRASFRILAIASGADDDLRSGMYRFPRGVSQKSLLEALELGHSTVRIKLTFPEGFTMRQMASLAKSEAGVDSVDFMTAVHDSAFLDSIGLPASSAEGFLMPDTYYAYFGEPARSLVRRMYHEFDQWFGEKRRERAAEMGYSVQDVLSLAALVEGETPLESEQPVVARLYMNRLAENMKLQADPTIQYALPEGPRRLKYSDYKFENPYNTYLYPGLPPTPIANPGRSAIDAVLYPADHDYLFMVAKGDGSRSHRFARTGSEHEKNVRLYHQKLASD